MTPEDRQEKIELYGMGFTLLMEALDKMPEAMWQFRPAEGQWSVHEIIIHLADSESNSALRARQLIAQPGGSLMGYDQDVWARELDYHSQDTDEALQVLKLARSTTYKLIKKLPDEIWANTVNHPEVEGPFSFELWLDIYAAHIPGHIQQMGDNLAAWETQK